MALPLLPILIAGAAAVALFGGGSAAAAAPTSGEGGGGAPSGPGRSTGTSAPSGFLGVTFGRDTLTGTGRIPNDAGAVVEAVDRIDPDDYSGIYEEIANLIQAQLNVIGAQAPRVADLERLLEGSSNPILLAELDDVRELLLFAWAPIPPKDKKFSTAFPGMERLVWIDFLRHLLTLDRKQATAMLASAAAEIDARRAAAMNTIYSDRGFWRSGFGDWLERLWYNKIRPLIDGAQGGGYVGALGGAVSGWMHLNDENPAYKGKGDAWDANILGTIQDAAETAQKWSDDPYSGLTDSIPTEG